MASERWGGGGGKLYVPLPLSLVGRSAFRLLDWKGEKSRKDRGKKLPAKRLRKWKLYLIYLEILGFEKEFITTHGKRGGSDRKGGTPPCKEDAKRKRVIGLEPAPCSESSLYSH